MVRPETRRDGELPTFWFPPQADSIQLSYWAFCSRIRRNSSRPFPVFRNFSRLIASARDTNSS